MALSLKDDIDLMREDLKRALQKEIGQRHWVMVIDTLKCIGCEACTVACKSENNTPPGVSYNVVIKREVGRYPNVGMEFISRPCMQCQNPPCTKVCPVKATWKGKDGVVRIDYKKCIGCRYCLTACPYGARYSDFGEYYTEETPQLQDYEIRQNYEYGYRWKRKRRLFFQQSPIGNARKCHFCLHRLEKGLLPACITTCLGKARYFGDLNDPRSLVAKLIAQHQAYRLKEELGTRPSVYYLK